MSQTSAENARGCMRATSSPLVTKTRLLAAYGSLIVAGILDQRQYRLADQVQGALLGVLNNVAEAQSAESRADFVHKLKLAQKECTELEWMLPLFVNQANLAGLSATTFTTLVNEINRILTAAITTTRRNMRSNKQ